jgi:hypothetical protein
MNFFKKKEKEKEQEIKINIFESIGKHFEESGRKYTSFYESIKNGTYKTDTGYKNGTYNKDKYFYKDKYIPNITTIMKELEENINNSIKNIKDNHKTELDSYSTTIINQIRSLEKLPTKDFILSFTDLQYEKEFKLLFPNNDYDKKGFNNLEYIITYYFTKINEGIIKSYPKYLKYK